jgi:hypothetical protein
MWITVLVRVTSTLPLLTPLSHTVRALGITIARPSLFNLARQSAWPWTPAASAKQPTRHPHPPTAARPRRSSWWYVSLSSTFSFSPWIAFLDRVQVGSAWMCVSDGGARWCGGVARGKTKSATMRVREHGRHWTFNQPNTRHFRHTPLIHRGHLASTAHTIVPDAVSEDEEILTRSPVEHQGCALNTRGHSGVARGEGRPAAGQQLEKVTGQVVSF